MLNVKRSVPLSLLLLLLLLSPCRAWEGKVVDVADGDGITVLHDGQDERIRLYGVDTPESRQDFGRKARSFTSDMVFGKTVEVKAFDTDRYGRTVAMVYVDGGKCLNEELLRAGLAWLYERFCNRPHCREWKQIELTAREGKVGLWADPNPVPPWEFRYSGGKQTPTGEGTPAGDFRSHRRRTPGDDHHCHGRGASVAAFHRERSLSWRHRLQGFSQAGLPAV